MSVKMKAHIDSKSSENEIRLRYVTSLANEWQGKEKGEFSFFFVSERKVVRYRNVFSGDLKVLIDRFMALVGRLDQMTQN